jgi:hypothetical protein
LLPGYGYLDNEDRCCALPAYKSPVKKERNATDGVVHPVGKEM